MAESWNILLDKNELPRIETNWYPLILKPTISAYGSKEDISVVDSESGLYDALKSFRERGYVG